MARTVYVSASSDERLKEWLYDEGYIVSEVHTEDMVSHPLRDHPDIFMCRLGIDDEAEVFSFFDHEDIVLGDVYPRDIVFNAACTGKYFIHNLKHTAPQLLTKADELGMDLINVRQGYTKCSTVIVDEHSIITYDRGIALPCTAAGLDVLTVSPGHVHLPGYDTGFIGGTSGRIADTIVFNGDLKEHPDFTSIIRFIEERGLKAKWFSEWPLTDIGSIL